MQAEWEKLQAREDLECQLAELQVAKVDLEKQLAAVSIANDVVVEVPTAELDPQVVKQIQAVAEQEAQTKWEAWAKQQIQRRDLEREASELERTAAAAGTENKQHDPHPNMSASEIYKRDMVRALHMP